MVVQYIKLVLWCGCYCVVLTFMEKRSRRSPALILDWQFLGGRINVARRENVSPTNVRSDKSIGRPSVLNDLLSQSCMVDLVHLESENSTKENVSELSDRDGGRRVVCPVCACWLANRGLSVKSWRYIDCTLFCVISNATSPSWNEISYLTVNTCIAY